MEWFDRARVQRWNQGDISMSSAATNALPLPDYHHGLYHGWVLHAIVQRRPNCDCDQRQQGQESDTLTPEIHLCNSWADLLASVEVCELPMSQ